MESLENIPENQAHIFRRIMACDILLYLANLFRINETSNFHCNSSMTFIVSIQRSSTFFNSKPFLSAKS